MFVRLFEFNDNYSIISKSMVQAQGFSGSASQQLCASAPINDTSVSSYSPYKPYKLP